MCVCVCVGDREKERVSELMEVGSNMCGRMNAITNSIVEERERGRLLMHLPLLFECAVID